jgi:DNA polymerase-3 subunit delta'
MSATIEAPWITTQAKQLLAQRGQAWLLAGPSGLGQYSLALALVRAWLCEQPSSHGACGSCGSCHAINVHTHADLGVLLPETLMLELGWPLSERAQAELDAKTRKPSKEIRIEAVRDTVEFAQRTSARGHGKAVLVFPAERMNTISANALLKTLEEPPGDVRFVLASDAAYQLLPTIRSRCQAYTMLWPDALVSLAWLQGQGIAPAEATVLLSAAGGRPDDALRLFQAGLLAASWVKLPKAIVHGDLSLFKDWPLAQTVDALHKLCHDLLALKMGASPRFFESCDLPTTGSVRTLTAWARALSASTRTIEHPFNPGLVLETLVCQAQIAISSK